MVTRTTGGLKSLTCDKGGFFQVRNAADWETHTQKNKTADTCSGLQKTAVINRRAYQWSDEFFHAHLLLVLNMVFTRPSRDGVS